MAFEIKNGVLNKYNAESGEIRVIVPDEETKIVTIQSPREFNNNERKRVEEKNREFVNLQ